jgi:hypothetical protein
MVGGTMALPKNKRLCPKSRHFNGLSGQSPSTLDYFVDLVYKVDT